MSIDFTEGVMKAGLWTWFISNGYSGVGFEIDLPGLAGRADAIGLDMLHRQIVLVEIKRTVSDFKRGRDKLNPTVYWDKAHLNYVATPANLINPKDLPPGWGLLEFSTSPLPDIVSPATLHTCPSPFFDRYVKLLLERSRDRMFSTNLVQRAFTKAINASKITKPVTRVVRKK